MKAWTHVTSCLLDGSDGGEVRIMYGEGGQKTGVSLLQWPCKTVLLHIQ